MTATIECTCYWTPDSEWTTYGGAVELGSQREHNPLCLVHPGAVNSTIVIVTAAKQGRGLVWRWHIAEFDTVKCPDGRLLPWAWLIDEVPLDQRHDIGALSRMFRGTRAAMDMNNWDIVERLDGGHFRPSVAALALFDPSEMVLDAYTALIRKRY